MAVVTTLSNHYKYQLSKGLINWSADAFKIILMNTTFAFDKDADATLADVTADQIATQFGYTQNNKALANIAVIEDDAGNQAQITCDDVSWTATGGSIGPSGAAIIYDDTTTDDTVVGCIDYGEDITALNGETFQIINIEVDKT